MELIQIAQKFAVSGKLASFRPQGAGNVNDTYLAVFRTHFSEERIIIQRVNGKVFAQPEWIMDNLSILTNHCHKQLAAEGDTSDRIWQLPRIVPCIDGNNFYRDEDGHFWRALTLIASASTYEIAQSKGHAYEVGMVLGHFHRLVSSMDSDSLRDTLPGFHETPKYLEHYDAVLESPEAKELIRKSIEVSTLLDFVEDRRDFAFTLENAIQSGELNRRLIHGDPKVSNIMIDDDTGRGTAIIDLDTVKPGLIHYDFGDALRSLCNREGEETSDLGKVAFDLDLCEAFVRGYMVNAGSFLTVNDRKYLYDSIRLISFELGLRFFQDYLAGNTYFKVQYPEQNLLRAKVQFRLCESIETRQKKIKALLNASTATN
ncbi:MAG: phosphotransferase enzyme family protein [Lentimonas sp.]